VNIGSKCRSARETHHGAVEFFKINKPDVGLEKHQVHGQYVVRSAHHVFTFVAVNDFRGMMTRVA
jgi:hypothetical protein